MDPNLNAQQWQQQYSNSNQQYAQPTQQQQSTGAPQYGYVPATQQASSHYSFAQQGASQPSYQSLMQAMPTQQSLPTAQLYQQYDQGADSVISAPSAAVGLWTETRPNAQWQTSKNNATTTTTTTTTTTKSTKGTQASQPQYATSSTALDFASLIQQAPQQQPVQQQQAFNYSQTMQSGSQQQTLLPLAPDFSQLMQNNPPPMQDTVGFSQLLQTQVSHAPPLVRTPLAPTPAQPSDHASKPTNKSTTTTMTKVVGSTSRKEAADKGQKELRRFDRDVSNWLKQYGGICPMGWDYYATRQGYLCGGTNHFVSHDDVEALLSSGRPPYIEFVNGPSHTRLVTPPPATGRIDGCGELPTWEAEPGWWERHKWRAGLDRTHPYGYPF